MAAMSTSVTEFSDNGNSRSYTLTGHTAMKPRMLLQRRKVATQEGAVAEDQVSILYGTTDSSDAPMRSRVMFTATFRRPVGCDADDVTAALAVFRDVIAGDEFGATVTTQNWLK